MRRQAVLTLGAVCLLLILQWEPTGFSDQTTKTPGKKHALLVGCTRYAAIPEFKDLQGPANDLPLFRQLLVDRFGFAADHITVLREADNQPDHRPTRANIQREFARLAHIAQAGDQVVILLGGHGTQQPDQEPFDEPDGLDEVFLPADAARTPDGKFIANAIVDDELKDWLGAIAARKAWIWLIVDACHSGTLVRDPGREKVRRIPPDRLIDLKHLDEARHKAVKTRSGTTSPQGLLGDAPPLVALYAALPTQTTPENKYDGVTDKYYGLLTFALCRVLSRATTPLTYRELAQKIHHEYIAWGERYNGPTPHAEGRDLDREVLGLKSWPQRSRLLLANDPELGWLVNGGRLQGLTEGSILAVQPPAGEGDQILGHVKVAKARLLEAEVTPCAHAKLPQLDKFPRNARCVPAYVEFHMQGMRLGLDKVGSQAEPKDWQRLAQLLADLGQDEASWLQLARAPEQADWLVSLENRKIFLAPAQAIAGSDLQTAVTTRFGPVSLEDSAGLKTTLQRLARARNLLQLSAGPMAEAGGGAVPPLDLELSLLKYQDAQDRTGEPLQPRGTPLVLQPGDWIGFRIGNPSQFPVDITLLFVDSALGITPLFPRPGSAIDHRIPPGESIQVARAKVSGTTTGLEHVVMLAVRGDGPPVDFTWLAQPSLEQASKTRDIRGVLNSPLGKLMQHALFARGQTRGLDSTALAQHQFRRVSWHVAPPK